MHLQRWNCIVNLAYHGYDLEESTTIVIYRYPLAASFGCILLATGSKGASPVGFGEGTAPPKGETLHAVSGFNQGTPYSE